MFGSQAYQLIKMLARSDKMAPRALIGYLVGFKGRNQYWIWNPRTGQVNKEQDVTFNKELRFDPKDPYLEDILVSEIPPETTVLDLPVIQKLEQFDTLYDDSESASETEELSTNQMPSTGINRYQIQPHSNGGKELSREETYPTPENSPERSPSHEGIASNSNLIEQSDTDGPIDPPEAEGVTAAPQEEELQEATEPPDSVQPRTG